MHILDTDTLSHLHEGNQNVIQAIQRLSTPEISTTIVTKVEMLRGRIDYILKAQADGDILKAQQLFQRTEDLLAQNWSSGFNHCEYHPFTSRYSGDSQSQTF
jgi:tRNA(fMet)-specific endonuclease VapC